MLLRLLLHCLIALVVGKNAAVSLAPHARVVIQHVQKLYTQYTFPAPCALLHVVTSWLFGYIDLLIITSCQL